MRHAQDLQESTVEPFELEQQPFCIESEVVSTLALLTYDSVIKEGGAVFNKPLKTMISIIYKMLGAKGKIFLDECFPSIKIGKHVLPITRSDNPRIIEVFIKDGHEIFEEILKAVLSEKLSPSDRVGIVKKLIRLGLAKEIVGSINDFLAALLNVDSTTIHRDRTDAK